MFNCITIIGCGLIGSSLMRAIEEKELSKDDIDDQKRFLLNHKVEILKSIN